MKQTYRRKPRRVEAMRFTGSIPSTKKAEAFLGEAYRSNSLQMFAPDEVGEIPKDLRGTYSQGWYRIHEVTFDGQYGIVLVQPGNWIVKDGAQTLCVTASDFRRDYELVI